MVSFSVLTLLFVSTVLSASIKPSSAATTGLTGVIIPLYEYPTDSSWAAVVSAHDAHPDVPIVAVVAPASSGSGAAIDQNFVAGISSLQAAGVTVIGYVDTQYAGRTITSAEADAANWWDWYHVSGIFLDEIANYAGNESFYSTLTSYAKSLGMTFTVGNPGTNIPNSYIGTVDSICEYEDSGLPSLSLLQSTQSGYPKSDFCYIAYGVQSLDTVFETNSAASAGWLYITDLDGGNPYGGLPTYFGQEVAALSPTSASSSTLTSTTSAASTTSSTAVNTTSTGTSAQTTTSLASASTSTVSNTSNATIYVQAASTNGSLLSGVLWGEIHDGGVNGSVPAQGPMPISFTGTVGQTYTVEVDNYGSATFSHWQDGSTTGSASWGATITITLTPGGVSLTAYFQT